jgi:hypothetical protein
MELVAHALQELGIACADLILKESVLFSAEGRETSAVMGFDEVQRHAVLFATTPQRHGGYVGRLSSCLRLWPVHKAIASLLLQRFGLL